MRISKTTSKLIVLIAILVVLLGLSTTAFYVLYKGATRKTAEPVNTSSFVAPQQILVGLPMRLKIPSIRVDAMIDQLGLMTNGDMQAPAGPKTVGWYRFGPRPGAIGSAVVDGHYGIWENGERSVFDELAKLKKGDEIYIEDDKGVVTTFVVRESRNFDPEANTTDVFKSNDGLAHLNLITCDGVWNTAAKSYDKRLVVFTDKQ